MTLNPAASVRARLLAHAKAQGEDFGRTLNRFASERLLYRLGASDARTRCILKGACLLAVWLPNPYRATRDLDLLAFGSPDDAAIRALVQEICAVPCPEDGLRFDLSHLRIDVIRPDDEYTGKRARFLAYLGTARIHLQMDFGFGDSLVPGPEEIEYPTLIHTLPAPRLRAYPREASVAEKFEAMVQLETRNSRMKDFHDLWALSGAFAFDGQTVRRAIAACFERRATPWTSELPRCLCPTFYQTPELVTRWRSYVAASSVLIAPPTQFEAIGGRIILFLGPVGNSLAAGVPFAGTWGPGGPWR